METISNNDLDIFIESIYRVIKEEDLEGIRKSPYWKKYAEIKQRFGDIIKDLRDHGYSDVAQKLYMEPNPFYTHACCHAEKLFESLSDEQKFITLLYCYRIYNHKQEMGTNPDNKAYRDFKIFVKELDNGTIEDWELSCFGYISSIDIALEKKFLDTDVLFWLQHEWQDLTGDYFMKQGGIFTRKVSTFTPRHYRAFNEIFKRVFGRDLKCINKYKEENDKTLIELLKEEL